MSDHSAMTGPRPKAWPLGLTDRRFQTEWLNLLTCRLLPDRGRMIEDLAQAHA